LSYETPHPPTPPEHGERLSKRGAVIATLPGTTRPCQGEALNDRHHPDCACHGTGTLVVKRPFGEGVLAEDDGLAATLEALSVERTGGVNEYLGDTPEHLMSKQVAKRTGSGSSKRSKKSGPLSVSRRMMEMPPKKWADGQRELTGKRPNQKEAEMQKGIEAARAAEHEAALLEARQRKGGRPARFGETRSERVHTSISAATEALLRQHGDDVGGLADSLMAEPDFAAQLALLKAERASGWQVSSGVVEVSSDLVISILSGAA
jgi:hypothetical protein